MSNSSADSFIEFTLGIKIFLWNFGSSNLLECVSLGIFRTGLFLSLYTCDSLWWTIRDLLRRFSCWTRGQA